MASVLAYPDPVAVRLPASDLCIAVLDLSRRCNDAAQLCNAVIPPTRRLLDAAREKGATIAFTVSLTQRDTADDGVADGLGRRPSEPVFYPDSFDKLSDPDLLAYLNRTGASNLLICGSSTNVCVMYTVTSAVRTHGFDVYVPTDCVNARTEYQNGYALYQLTHLPRRTRPVRLTTSDMVTFV